VTDRFRPVVIGVADHSGWAHLVSVAAVNGAPGVIDRRRVELIEKGVPNQPYHHETLAMSEPDAEQLLDRVRKSISSFVDEALKRLSADLKSEYRVKALTLREPTLPSLPATVAEVHASYRVTCAADGMLYHSAICRAARERKWEVEFFRRGGTAVQAAEAMSTSLSGVERFLDDLGKALGPPWTKEHRDAAAAAIALLGQQSELGLRG
jgi:hypothetical protein